MPRNYGRTATSMWNDPDFLNLSPEARFTYSMLFNQANITPVGVIGLTIKRFARNTGYSPATVQTALDELTKHEYVVVDDETEELFVRTFVKHDGGINNDLRRKAVMASADSVASTHIRASIAVQLDRLGVEHHLSIGPTEGLDSRRVVVKEGDHQLEPQPSSSTREGTEAGSPMPSALDASAEPPTMFCTEHPNGTTEACGPCGTAKMRYKAWTETKLAGELAARAARAEAIAECPRCDESGIRLDEDTGRPLGRCDHADPSVTS